MKRDDTGAALPLVLILVTVVAVVLGALLSFADTSVRATVNLRDQASAAYTADGALQAGINGIRNSTFTGASGQHCFGGSDTLDLPNFGGGGSAAVTCSADPAKVLIQCPSLSACNRPGNAILTLGTGGEDGLTIQQPTGSAFRVHGVVYSNSNINVVNGSLDTNTAVYARGACAGTIRSTPAASCGYGGSALGADPGYAPALTSVPAHRAVPGCTGPVVTFEPGFYDDAVGLSALMTNSSPCKDSIWWFKPGAYYFDFRNSSAARPPGLPAGDDVWTVNSGRLVAGTPVDRAGRVIAAPSAADTAIPGACDNPIEDASAVGVQFVFGGDSRLAVKAAEAEICGSYSGTKPPVALYGLTSGAEAPVTATLTPSGTPSGTFTSAPAGSLSTVDGNLATWTNNGNGNQSATVTATGYAPPAAIPAGSLLTSAKIRVVHGNDNGSSQDALSVQLGADKFGVPSYSDKVLHTDLVDVTGALSQQVYDGGFTGAQLAYTAAVKHKGTEQVDALQLELTYTPPALRAQSGCTQLMYVTSAACALVTSVNTSGNRFYVQGTTYAPKAVLDITLNNAIEPIFRFGVIARSLQVKLTGSVSFTGPVIEVPDDSPGFVFGVYLAAYVCPGASTCTPAGTPAARARVAYVDGDPAHPVAGARQVSVLSWSGNR
ncbi:hypothetical protein [Amycolatopsis eburnea]|uniref:Uncharacterized protein n=1 Tax=Amycolatopsis eburnea TaxID=2267691 RepID=A0A3R9DT96_9PSEU|nr:hypothetical protein [Amycolatopsis eburnea]RSD09546.1 hypothetical protein EIY87_41720 [Amycolatopsis eburnea]